MPDEFQLKGKVRLDTSEVNSLPEKIKKAMTLSERMEASRAQRISTSAVSGERVRAGAGAGPLGAIIGARRAIAGAEFRQLAEEASQRRTLLDRFATAEGTQIRRRAAAAAQVHGLSSRIATQARLAAVEVEEKKVAEVRERKGRPTDRPAAVGGRSGSVGAGLFRGFAQSLTAGTGIGVPFLSLSPTFIAASVAASVLTVGIKAAFGAVSELSKSLQELRQTSGGTMLTVSRISATARTFGVDTKDVTQGIGEMRAKMEAGDPAFKRFGISLTNSRGEARSAADVYNDVRDAISQITDPTLQAGAANDFFGKSAQSMMNVLRQAPSVIKANATAIESSARAGVQAVTAQAAMEQKAASGKKIIENAMEAIGTRTTESIGFWADTFSKIGEERDAMAAKSLASQKKAREGASQEEIALAGKTAYEASKAAAEARRATPQADVGVSGLPMSVNALKDIASAAVDAKSQISSLNQSLLAIGNQRIQIAFAIKSTEIQIANAIYDQNQSLANQAQDRAMQLQEQVAALTISLNSFNAAEQSAAIRAREAEKRFFAFRPDNALARANAATRYERDRQQQIERNARTNAEAQRQFENQKLLADIELANMARQEVIVAAQIELFNATHTDVDKNFLTSMNNLRAAQIAQESSTAGMLVKLDVTVNSDSFSAEENAKIRAEVLRIVAAQAAEAITIVRGRGRMGGEKL